MSEVKVTQLRLQSLQDGQTERVNQELEQYLRMFIDHWQEQWLEWLEMAEFAYNNKVNTLTNISLFRANSGRDPRMGFEMRRNEKLEGAREDEEDARRSISSIEKGIGGNKETSR